METARQLFGTFFVLLGMCTMIAALTGGHFFSILAGWAVFCFGTWAGGFDRPFHSPYNSRH